ncbi:MAG: hypothetical protein ACYCVB_12185 [Bacilli bacterium]
MLDLDESFATRKLCDAIRKVIPEEQLELLECHSPHGLANDLYMDITRIREDIGFHFEYDVERGVKDYVAWLQTGNER